MKAEWYRVIIYRLWYRCCCQRFLRENVHMRMYTCMQLSRHRRMHVTRSPGASGIPRKEASRKPSTLSSFENPESGQIHQEIAISDRPCMYIAS